MVQGFSLLSVSTNLQSSRAVSPSIWVRDLGVLLCAAAEPER